MARLAVRLFFRRVEVEGRERVPVAGPVLFVANHTNALVDPLVLLIGLRRPLTITAKRTLANNPLLAWPMSRLGVITFDRREDAGPSPPDQRHNVNAMRRCREVLAAGGAVCIFPEGVSHSDPGLRPFKAGPARIALDFLRKETGAGPLRIVPVGLLYTRKDHPRSDVWLRFGEPLDVGQWKTEHPDGDSESLTHELQRRVEEVALSFATRREAALVAWAAEIVATGGDMTTAKGRPPA